MNLRRSSCGSNLKNVFQYRKVIPEVKKNRQFIQLFRTMGAESTHHCPGKGKSLQQDLIFDQRHYLRSNGTHRKRDLPLKISKVHIFELKNMLCEEDCRESIC